LKIERPVSFQDGPRSNRELFNSCLSFSELCSFTATLTDQVYQFDPLLDLLPSRCWKARIRKLEGNVGRSDDVRNTWRMRQKWLSKLLSAYTARASINLTLHARKIGKGSSSSGLG